MMDFFETVAGREFTQYTLPRLIESIDRLCDTAQRIEKRLDELEESRSGEKEDIER